MEWHRKAGVGTARRNNQRSFWLAFTLVAVCLATLCLVLDLGLLNLLIAHSVTAGK
jgi:hypothetical protein